MGMWVMQNSAGILAPFPRGGLNSVFCGSRLRSGSIVSVSIEKKKRRREYITYRIVLLNSFLNVCICVLGCGVKCIFFYSGLWAKQVGKTLL